MARKRMISPQIWEDPSFNKLSIQARLLFIGMFSNADDEGYFRADSGGLKRLIFGFDEIKQDEIIVWRGELTTHIKNIHFFENNGEEYAHFIKWDKIQKQQKDRIQESLYPKCPICLASAKQVLTEVKLSKGKIREDNSISEGKPSQTNELIKLFESLNPMTYRKWFANKTQRAAVERLSQSLGREKIELAIQAALEAQTTKFAPQIFTPLQLEDKLAELRAFIIKENKNKKWHII